MSIYDKPVRGLMKDMVEGFGLQPGQQFTRTQAIQWFAKLYPKIKIATITAHLVRLSTNAQSRLHYSAKPSEDDLFYQLNSGLYRLYDPSHDPPPIHQPGPGVVGITTDDQEMTTIGGAEFAYERDLRNYLSKNLSIVEQGLKLYEEDGINGIEFPAGGRFIDILASDAQGSLVVIELKVSRGYDRVVGQLMRYMAWIHKNLAEPNQKVRGVIIAREISDDLVLACSLLKDLVLFEYELSVALKPISSTTNDSQRC